MVDTSVRTRSNKNTSRIFLIIIIINIFFLKSFPECANTEQFRKAGSQKKIGFKFFQLTEESNPGRLGEKREGYLCAMPSPHFPQLIYAELTFMIRIC